MVCIDMCVCVVVCVRVCVRVCVWSGPPGNKCWARRRRKKDDAKRCAGTWAYVTYVSRMWVSMIGVYKPACVSRMWVSRVCVCVFVYARVMVVGGWLERGRGGYGASGEDVVKDKIVRG